MKKYLLLVLLFSGLYAGAQNSNNDGNCKAQFKYEINTKLMSPLPVTAVNFYDASEGNVVAWFWDFGDRNTSNEQNPLFVFSRQVPASNVKINPYRPVSLTVLTSDSCKSFYVDTVNIMEGFSYNETFCNAGFKYYKVSSDSVGGTTSIQFTNLSEGDSLSYFWQFDTEQTSTEKEPIIIFDNKQYEHKVCLKVSGANNCSSTFCDVVYLTNPVDTSDTPNDCYSGFYYSINHDIQTFAPALVLDFKSISDPDAIEWKWDFGDGSTSEEENPLHVFNYPQVEDSTLQDPNPFREVCLTVKTISGCIAKYCKTINIYMNDSTNIDPNKNCRAGFKYYQPSDVITIPELVPYQFIDASEGEVVSRLWEFEDGTTSTEPDLLKNFDFQIPYQKVYLTITTADSCTSTWCETIFIRREYPDTVTINHENDYVMRYESGFSVQMSSCAGWVKAQVYLKDSIIDANYYKWSHDVEGQEANGFCPTQTYSVKAKTPEGIIVSGTFVFNADGTVTEIPISWWISGQNDNQMIQYNVNNRGYLVEWKLCDGTVVKGDSIPLNLVNCNNHELNLILRDSLGNVVYSESISKSIATSLGSLPNASELKIFPNPVNEVLTIQYSGKKLDEMTIEISDISGKKLTTQNMLNVESGQTIGVNVNSFKNGIYICRITSKNQIIGIKKFTK